MPRPVRSASALTPLESLMWRLESDRALSSTFGSVSILDREPDPDRFRRRMIAVAGANPRLRQRIDGSSWVVDPDFDIDRHLRWEHQPAGGTDDDVLTRAADLVAEPFDPRHPLWTFVIVTGLPGDRAALVQRMHHALTDGEGGVRLSETFVDLSADGPDPAPDPFVGDDDPGAETTWLERTVLGATDVAGGLARTMGDAARWTVDGLSDPGRFASAGADLVETTRSLGRQIAVLDPSHSEPWRTRSTERRLVAGSIPFGPVRTAATAAGVSINDVFVTAVVRGATAYHRDIGGAPDTFRLAMPVSTRRDGSAGGNAFSPMRALVASGADLTALAHLRVVSTTLAATKTERAGSLVEPVAALSELMPDAVVRNVVRRQASTVDITASNVRAAPIPLYIAGARIEATYAAGPLASTAANVTMMSYDGRIDLGIHVDAQAVDRPELLRDTVIGAFHEVTESAGTLT
ncbi:MAG: wax ester/triacylglycerol synthase domain-containing protein [Acidimicrobiales bacterium]